MIKSTSDCLFLRTSTHIEVLFSWRDAITCNVAQYLTSVLSLNNEPDLLEDVVRLLLGNADPLGRGDLEALGHQEVGHLPRPRGLKHLPVVTVNI